MNDQGERLELEKPTRYEETGQLSPTTQLGPLLSLDSRAYFLAPNFKDGPSRKTNFILLFLVSSGLPAAAATAAQVIILGPEDLLC